MSSVDARRLRSVDIFSDLSSEVAERIAAACKWARYAKGRQILGQMDDTSDLYLAVEGTVRVIGYSSQGKVVSFSDISAPSIFGEFAAIDRKPRSASVVALEECVVGRLGSDRFRAVLLAEPEVMLRTLEKVVGKARQMTDRVLTFSVLPAHARLHIELLRMADMLETTAEAGRIEPAPTHQTIAERISSHREAITREMRRLRGMGVIDYDRTAIVVRDGGALRRLIRESGYW